MLCQMSLKRVSFSIKVFQFVLFHERYNMQGTSLPEIAASYYAEYKTKVEAHVNLTIKYKLYRWLGAALLTLLFLLRIIISRKYFMITYFLYVYILVAFVAFITPFEEAEGGLPINDTEDKGYRRNLPEFDFWRKYTTAHLIAFFSSLFPFMDIPVFVPVLVFYAAILTVFMLYNELQRGFMHQLSVKETIDRWFNMKKPSYIAGHT